ncbi:glycosyltransferase family 25 protein [Amphiplicatus metriothermophilus]|uniref:Glycosyltransferase family 25 (LPS biosynthesis protein) n=1 Tax=Amphiplicatus metriothermophilus TaxID=1519374 RepID=A0A239PXQ2_9PROT|nr:glycosyltransferase family 25 protein [Amphiplicatus metriothermophilus]MBB5519860.1 hypothetical protein [Amphiplicatus metriothermophilus]SNT75089.1 Glycosyltransferase family 25 (LPS biosynthesis protein) [Amphiplicatus metriothermophilus]
MLHTLFSRIYVINLESRPDRRREMAGELARIGLSFDHPAASLFSAVRPEDAGPFPSLGARGCFMSHLGVLADAEARGEGAIAILEDDAAFAPDFAARAPALLDALARRDWGVFYGGHRGLETGAAGLVEVPPARGVGATHFICLNGPAIGPARRYLEAMLARPRGSPEGGPMHVDGAYGWFRRDNPAFATFAAAPPLAVQRSSRSDVEGARWFDRAPVLREAAALARRVLRRG